MRLLRRSPRAPATLLLLGCALLPSWQPSASPAVPEPSPGDWILLHRVRSQGVDLPVRWLSRLEWAHTGGEAAQDALGRMHLPLLPSSRDLWVIDGDALEARLATLPLPVGAPVVAPPAEAALLVTWEPGVELVDLGSTEWLTAVGDAATRVSFHEVRGRKGAEHVHGAQSSGARPQPAEVRAVMTRPDPEVHPSRASKARAGLGYFSLTDSGARFAPRGELDSGADPNAAAWLCIARDGQGRLRFWFEADTGDDAETATGA